MTIDRAAAYGLMTEWTTSESLRTHMLAVETAVAAYARHEGADEELWAATALLHDFDYERHPALEGGGHPFVGVEHLRGLGAPEEMLEAILGHADHTGVPRTSRLALRMGVAGGRAGWTAWTGWGVRHTRSSALSAS